jgi:hypothetical protein
VCVPRAETKYSMRLLIGEKRAPSNLSVTRSPTVACLVFDHVQCLSFKLLWASIYQTRDKSGIEQRRCCLLTLEWALIQAEGKIGEEEGSEPVWKGRSRYSTSISACCESRSVLSGCCISEMMALCRKGRTEYVVKGRSSVGMRVNHEDMRNSRQQV